MKKKFLTSAIATLLIAPCFAFVGCNKGNNSDGDTGKDLTIQQIFKNYTAFCFCFPYINIYNILYRKNNTYIKEPEQFAFVGVVKIVYSVV